MELSPGRSVPNLRLDVGPWNNLNGSERTVAKPSKAAPLPNTSRLLTLFLLPLAFELMTALRLLTDLTVQGHDTGGKAHILRPLGLKP